MMKGDATFVAPATPFGHSGVAVIRINGPLSRNILSELSRTKIAKPKTVTLRKLYDSKENLLDECLVTHFVSPSSYTGDDMVEISCHGNPVIVDKIIKTINEHGARPAEPGEFTKRAFINGKLDLLQAEAVGALIKSKSEVAAKINQQTLNGGLSAALIKIRASLITLAGKIEHAIDISEAEIASSFYKECTLQINAAISSTKEILSTFKAGKMLNEGIRVVITGKPNVGKSTLINCLSGSKRAIVSDVPGTTRDTVESEVLIDGVAFRLIDTAGIHPTEDKIEKIGIDKANDEIDFADLVLYVFDKPSIKKLPKYSCPHVHILNKNDLHKLTSSDNSIIHISAKTGYNVDYLLKKIKKMMLTNPVSTDTPHLISQHQNIAMNKSLQSQKEIQSLLKYPQPELEIVAFETREAIEAIDGLMGKTSPDDILNNVFETLCVGK